MKKIILAIFAVSTLALISCGSTPKTETKTSTTSEKPAKPASLEITSANLPDGEASVMDNFEDGNYWKAIGNSWGDNDKSISCDLSTDFGTDGEHSLKCNFAKMEDHKAGFVCDYPLDPDWTGAKTVALDVFNPNEFELNMCVVLQTGENWIWNQSEVIPCPVGANTITFDISGFSSLDNVMRMVVYHFGPSESGCFYIDNYRVFF